MPAFSNATYHLIKKQWEWAINSNQREKASFEEKNIFLKEALRGNYILLFQHDLFTECCELFATEKGIWCGKKFRLSDLD